MSTQLDPVTGAPLLTPDLGNIDQLPYSVQPVPLQDQTNQPQLGRTYLYPDDVPPVLANINAMNGTQPDQAQTLHTDGEHRLLVASSGGGGGGAAIVPTTTVFNDNELRFDSPGSMLGNPYIDTSKKVYVFTGGVSTNTQFGAGDRVTVAMWVGFMDIHGAILPIVNILINVRCDNTGAPYGVFGDTQTVVFPNGLDLSTVFGHTTNTVQVAAGGSDVGAHASASAVMG